MSRSDDDLKRRRIDRVELSTVPGIILSALKLLVERSVSRGSRPLIEMYV
jgi:hypothetical protein